MHRLSALLALTVFLAGCSGKQSGDVGAFLLQQATKLGARAQQTNGLPQVIAHWYYKQEADSCKIYIVGDHVNKLQSFLSAAFGPPIVSDGITGYYGSELGIDLNYALQIRNGGKEQVTSVVMARRAP